MKSMSIDRALTDASSGIRVVEPPARQLDFTPTPAVQSARRRGLYVTCPSCGSSSQRYLFHRTGARFVRCKACDVVYADPIDPAETAGLAAPSVTDAPRDSDRRNAVSNFAALMTSIISIYERRYHRPPRAVLVVGRWQPEFAGVAADLTSVMGVADVIGIPSERAGQALITLLGERLRDFDIIVFNDILESVHEPERILNGLARRLPVSSLVAVAFTNMRSLPSRTLRRRSRSFFTGKVAFYDASNLELLMWRLGFRRIANGRLTWRYSLGYVAARLGAGRVVERGLMRARLSALSVRIAAGHEVILFEPSADAAAEQLSIIVPVYNEERYVRSVLTALLSKQLPIDREVVIVESNSSDSSREIVRSFEGRPGVRIIYQDRPRGKGHAVRAGLEQATGSVILIQDADFEYDIDDYDALLEPILQRRAAFVLGSRSLGLDDWKVRKYAHSRVKGYMMNFAQVVFARTFNVLYQQRVSDINTMLKVFRRECIEGCALTGDGFNFDIELVCKIVRNGFSPFEVPVNYVARSFDEGKKINFLLDAYPSYYQLFRCRLGRV